MKNLIVTTIVLFLYSRFISAQVAPPSGWGDFKFGLVNDGSDIFNTRMKNAIQAGCKLDYRYAYVHNGPDQATNSLTYLFGYGNNYATDGNTRVATGVKPAFVIYMLQEDATFATFQANIKNATFMKKFFATVKTVAQKANGNKAIFVIEPDTWGYILEAAKDPTTLLATVNNLGTGYEHLTGLPNTASGVCQGILKTIRTFAPDAYCGVLMSHWGYWAGDANDPGMPKATDGMVWWTNASVDIAAQKNADFFNKLFQGSADKGDFVGVEKYGYSAGAVKKIENSNRFYWGDVENAKYIRWCNKLSIAVNKPLLGWQISIGHLGLKNSCTTVGTNCSFEDTFFPYFFTHVQDYIEAGFIGFLAGKGMDDDTDYANASEGATVGDGGWFFNQLQSFDLNRPYLGVTTSLPNDQFQQQHLAIEMVNLQWQIKNLTSEIQLIKIADLQGKIVLEKELNPFEELNLNELSKGIYLLTNNISTRKFAVW
jgi:hypothetical protein